MKIQKCYELINISISYGNRHLEYDSKFWMATYFYKDTNRRIPISVDRYWKALRKWHKLKYGDNLIAPVIKIEEIN